MLAAACALSTQSAASDINTGGQLGVARCLSGRTLGFTGLNAGAGFEYQWDDEYVADLTGTTPKLLSGNVFVNYGLLSWWDIGVNLPVFCDIPGWDDAEAGVGDLEVAVKLAIPPGRENCFFSQALYGSVTMPTGSRDRGYFPSHAWYSTVGKAPHTSTYFLWHGVVAWSFDLKRLWPRVPVQIHANFGGVLTKWKEAGVFTGALALEYAPWEMLSFFVELSGESRKAYYSHVYATEWFRNDPMYLTPGARLSLPNGTWMTLAGDFGISRRDYDYPVRTTWDKDGVSYATAPTPRYGVQLTVGWSRRLLRRGANVDSSAVRGDDGQAAPPAPAVEQAPCRPETVMVAAAEQAPCLPDTVFVPSTMQSRSAPETVYVAAAAAAAPAPAAGAAGRGGLVLKNVYFDQFDYSLTAGARGMLDLVAASLLEWPEVRIEIQGHADSIDHENNNMQISHLRAEAVRDYLVGMGVARERLSVASFGESRPVANNGTKKGREANRRVELINTLR
jgi:outer membrane protein OmpA-like peptidoglycan-associated protein